jgi:hypothetical protein
MHAETSFCQGNCAPKISLLCIAEFRRQTCSNRLRIPLEQRIPLQMNKRPITCWPFQAGLPWVPEFFKDCLEAFLRVRKGWGCGAIMISAFLGGHLDSLAVAPSNDACENAMVIPGGGPFPYLTLPVDIADATTVGDPATNSCRFFSPSSSRSTWYQFSPEKNGRFELSVCKDDAPESTVYDTIMAVYLSPGGCAGPFTEISQGCNDDACGVDGLQSKLVLDLAGGETYYVVVWQIDDAVPSLDQRTLQMEVSRIVIPLNDTCAGLEMLPLQQAIYGSTVGAENHYQLNDPACFEGDANRSVNAHGIDVVYGFAAPSTGTYLFKVSGYSTASDLVVYVASSCPESPAPAVVTSCLGAANRNPVSSTEAVVCVSLAKSEEVIIFVDENPVETSAGSSFIIEASRCRPEVEPNNTPLTATLLANSLVGGINYSGDVDFFHLGSPGDGSRVFTMIDAEASSSPNFDLRVISDRETLEYDDDNNDSFFGDSGPNVAGTILSFKPAYLRVNFNGVIGEPYFLYSVIQPPLDLAIVEAEPNDDISLAQSSPLAYYRASLDGPSPSGDVDVYAFNAQPGDLIYLGLDGDPLRNNTPIDARLELLDDLGNVLISVNDTSGDSSTNRMLGSMEAVFPKSPGESLVYPVLNSGTYYARVSIGQPTIGDNGSGDYLLSISLNLMAEGRRINRNPVLQAISVPDQVVQGDVISLEGAFDELDFGQTHQLTVDWGDSNGMTNEYFVNGERDFQLSYVYAQPPSGMASGDYTISLLLRDHLGGEDATALSIRVDRVAPARFISIQSQPDGAKTLLLQGAPFTEYQLQSSPDASSWIPGDTLNSDQDGFMNFTDGPSGLPPARFYRAIAP